jgi:hypothetical protein
MDVCFTKFREEFQIILLACCSILPANLAIYLFKIVRGEEIGYLSSINYAPNIFKRALARSSLLGGEGQDLRLVI